MGDDKVYNKALASVRAARLDVQNMLGFLHGSHMATKKCHEDDSSESEDDEYTLQVVLPPQLPLPSQYKNPLPAAQPESKVGPWETIKGFWSKIAPVEHRDVGARENFEPIVPRGRDAYGREPIVPRGRDAYGREPIVPKQQDVYGREPIVPRQQDVYGREPIVPRQQDVYGREPIVPRQQDAYGREQIVPRDRDAYGREQIVPKQQDAYGREPIIPRDRDAYGREQIVPRDRDAYGRPVTRGGRDGEATNTQLQGSYQMFESVLSGVEKEQQKQKQLLTTLY